jgi:hypothetical protein
MLNVVHNVGERDATPTAGVLSINELALKIQRRISDIKSLYKLQFCILGGTCRRPLPGARMGTPPLSCFLSVNGGRL